jgi:hypothetical protein
MTRNDLEKRFSDLETALLKLTEPKPSMLRKLWNRIKPGIVPFILGVIVGNFAAAVFTPQTILEQQAALGGAAIPFLNSSLSPKPLTLPQENSIAEPSDSSLTNTSELPSLVNRPADDGQATSTKSFRRLVRPIP